jgi:hypothetical protein
VNQGSYQNQINFDGQTASHHWQCLSDAYVVIPISVSSSTGTAYTSTTVIAPKDGGIDNLITDLSVGDVQDVWLTESSGQTPLINSLRKTLEKDQEWLDNEASESMYTQTTNEYVAQDCVNALATPNLTYGLNSQPFVDASGANVTVGTFASQSIRNPLYNKAFQDAAKSFVLQCPFDSTTASFRGNVIVKLKNLHLIFECNQRVASQVNFVLQARHRFNHLFAPTVLRLSSRLAQMVLGSLRVCCITHQSNQVMHSKLNSTRNSKKA